jgi:glutaredoxin-like protein
MTLIPSRETQLLKDHFAKELTGPVTIRLYTQRESRIILPIQECATCKDTRELLTEVAGLSDRIRLETHDFAVEADSARAAGIDRIPAFVLEGAARGRVRYFGIPSGYEFTSLIQDLTAVSRGATGLAASTREALSALTTDVHIKVFVTPTCPYCPGIAHVAHLFAVESPRVTADVIEASEFPDLVQRYGVSGVPRTVINETIDVMGAVPEARFLEAVLQTQEALSP